MAALDAWRVEGHRLLALASAPEAADEIAAAIDDVAERLRSARQARPTQARRLTPPTLSRTALDTCFGLASTFLDAGEVVTLSRVSHATHKLATTDHLWEEVIQRECPEAEYLRTSALNGMRLYRRPSGDLVRWF